MNKKEIEAMSWRDFMGLEEVQVDESPRENMGALFYNDGNIQVSVDVVAKTFDENGNVLTEGHDDISVWEDEELAEELRELVIEELTELENMEES